MRNKIVSIVAILIVAIVLIVAVKTGAINVFSKTPQEYSQSSSDNEISDDEPESINNETVVYEDNSRNEDSDNEIIHRDEEAVYEYIKKNVSGNTKSDSMRYSFKYIDCTVSQTMPDGLDRENAVYHSILIKDDNGEPATDESGHPMYDEPEVDADGNFTDDTYYVTVTYEVTNKMDEGWDNEGVHPQNFIIGYLDERDNFQYITEPLGNIYGKSEYRGTVILDKDETVVITNCYDVKKELIDTHQLVVRLENVGGISGAKVPYLAIDDYLGVTDTK